MDLKSDQKNESRTGNQAFPVLVVAVILLSGFILWKQIASRVVSSVANIHLAKTLEIKIIDYQSYPICQNSGHYTDLDNQFSRAVALDPSNRAAWQNLVKLRWAGGDCAAVEEMLDSGAGQNDRSLAAISALLDIHFERFKGRASYPRAAEIGNLFTQAGKEADEAGLVAEAVRWYETAFLFDPTVTTADWLATYYTAEADTQRFHWIWEYMAQEKAGTDDGWWAKFHQAKIAGNIDEEIDALKRGAESSMDPFQFWVDLGDVYKRLQAYEDAIRAFEEAHRIRPVQIGPVINIGDSYRLKNDLKTAESYFALAHSMDINNYYVYYYMSVTYRSMGRLDDAIIELQKGIAIQEQQGLNPWEWYQHIGNWYIEGGNCSEAKTAFEQALEWQPGDASLQDAIRDVENCEK